MKTDERIRQRAWLGLLDTDRETLYLSLLANRMRRTHLVTSTIVAVGSTAALASFVVGVSGVIGGAQAETARLLSGVIGSAISLLVAVVAIWSMISDFLQEGRNRSLSRGRVFGAGFAMAEALDRVEQPRR